MTRRWGKGGQSKRRVRKSHDKGTNTHVGKRVVIAFLRYSWEFYGAHMDESANDMAESEKVFYEIE